MRRLFVLLGLMACASTAAAQDLWTWTLYEDGGALALANEVPDTSKLAAVLECKPGDGVAKVSVFPNQGADRSPPVVGEMKTADAAFVSFVRTGKLSLKTDAGSGEIAMDPAHRAKLERFARLCGA